MCLYSKVFCASFLLDGLVRVGLRGLRFNVDWPLHGLTSKEERYSPLHQITDKNVSRLKPEWYTEIPSIDDGLSATPIVKEGVIYMTGSFANVFAIDGKTGKPIWEYNSGTRAHNSLANSWGARVNRGVAVAHGRVFVATPDCRLIALDAVKGTRIWEELTCDPTREYTITRRAQGRARKGFYRQWGVRLRFPRICLRLCCRLRQIDLALLECAGRPGAGL